MKEVLNALKKHKILLVVTLIVCILCFSVNIYAAESSIVDSTPSYEELVAIASEEVSDKTFYAQLSDCTNYCIYRYESSLFDGYTYMMVCSSKGFAYTESSAALSTYFAEFDAGVKSPAVVTYGISDGDGYYCAYVFEFSENWSFLGSSGISSNSPVGELPFNIGDKGQILSSSVDVYYLDDTDSVFFQVTPLEATLTVGGLTQETLAGLTMKEMIGLIPLVIGFLTLALALWKGWTLLVRSLKRA